ncbi:MAG: hypothetical protein GX083_04890 [Clostridiales bacterium]|nr:hypothetical protein [Clostridiales bacterium]
MGQGVAETDDNGEVRIFIPEGKNVTAVAINYKGGRVQLNQYMTDDPIYNFTTVPVTVKLQNSTGEDLSGTAKHYGTATDGWLTFAENGESGSTMEMLPSKYTFQMNYKGALQNN